MAAKSLLSDKGVAFLDIAVDSKPELRAEMTRISGERTVPQIWVGETHVGGYTELAALERGGDLDLLLDA
jgi:glutaredoxin 3